MSGDGAMMMAAGDLDGTLTREQRVLIAQDVIAVLRSRQRRITIEQGTYFFSKEIGGVPRTGQLRSNRIKGGCTVCARGALFLASVDRFDSCDLKFIYGQIRYEVEDRTEREWGGDQTDLIESCFEGVGVDGSSKHDLYIRFCGNPRGLLLAICENIVANNGEFKPETSLRGTESTNAENGANASL